MLNVLTAIWNARLLTQRFARQSAQKHVTELDTKRVIFQQSHTNSIQFVINKVAKKPYSASCFVSKAGVLTSKFA